MGSPVIINMINVTSSRPELISQNCLTVVMEHIECQKQPKDTGEEKYDEEMLT